MQYCCCNDDRSPVAERTVQGLGGSVADRVPDISQLDHGRIGIAGCGTRVQTLPEHRDAGAEVASYLVAAIVLQSSGGKLGRQARRSGRALAGVRPRAERIRCGAVVIIAGGVGVRWAT